MGVFRTAILIGLGAVLLGMAALYLRSPPRLLDVVNSLWPGDAGVARVAQGEAYGPGPLQKLDVWVPSAIGAAKRPVVIFYHGGGWVKGARGDYGFAAKAFAARGFVVVVPDYRKVPQILFPVFVEDAAGAVRWTRDNIARFGGDPGRIALAGHSAGAYAAIMLSLDTRYLTDAGVPADTVKAAVGLSGPYDFYPFEKRRAIDAMGKWPRPLETQPITYARADAPPLLLLNGTEDTTTRPRNAVNLSKRMAAVGGTAEVKLYPGLDHEDVVMALSKLFRGKAPVVDDSVAFLNAKLAPAPQSRSTLVDPGSPGS